MGEFENWIQVIEYMAEHSPLGIHSRHLRERSQKEQTHVYVVLVVLF